MAARRLLGEEVVTAIPAVARWERRLTDAAHEVWFVNEPIRRWHADRYPDAVERMKVVANGFDEYGTPLAVPFEPRPATAPLVFGYVGTISEKVPLRELVAGWRHARATVPSMAGARLVLRGYLGHFGAADGALTSLVDAAREDGVSFEGPVSKADVAATYRQFDALVLALGTGRYVTSGKVFEYAATGLPIVSVHDPGNAATDVVRESPAWTAARSLGVEDVATALARAADLVRAETPESRRAAQAWGAQYERSRQLAPRIASLRAHVSGRLSGA